jgi:hypothetical protein
MLKILVLSILLFGITTASYAACAPSDEVDKYLLLQFKEEKSWVGITDTGNDTQQITILYENPETGGWTIAFNNVSTGITCVVAGGQSSSYLLKSNNGPKL